MGLDNRDYAREHNRSSASSIGGRFNTSSVVVRLIIFTVGVFIAQNLFQRPFEEWLMMYGPAVYGKGQIWRTITYAFLHDRGGLMHLGFNMLGLYWFGRELEQMYGSREFFMFYICAAVFAAIIQMASGFATGTWYWMLGASGSVMGLLALYAVHFPMRKIYIWGVIPMQMRFLVPMIIISDLVMNNRFNANIAGSAHIGGLLFGFIYYFQKIRLERILGGGLLGGFKERTKARKVKRSNLKVYAPDDRTPSPTPSISAASALDEQVDHILAKINEHGRDSLTDHENKILEEASRIARERKS